MRRCSGAAMLAACVSVTASANAEGLEPYQMIRSLQLVQDRIADGDHAALPIQRRLLAIIDERLHTADFENPHNFRALLIYGASGGNPATLDAVISRLKLDEDQSRLSNGLTQYARGDLRAAREMLSATELSTLDPELAAPLALVIGSLLAQQAPTEALRFFDQARLISPGTLIEEAALRRSLTLSAELRDPERFALASRQYAWRFLRSPYASQFAEAFVSGVVALRGEIDLAVVEEIVANMRRDQAHVIYLRIARQSAIEGYDNLLTFASRNADKYADSGGGLDPRSVLYGNMALVASEDVKDVLHTLEQIDAKRLSPNDHKLLNAAREVARKILSRPAAGSEASARQSSLPEGEAVVAQESEDEQLNGAFVADTLKTLQSIDVLIAEARR